MNPAFSISILNDAPLLLSSTMPNELSRYHIPGSCILSGAGHFGSLLFQLIESAGFACLYSVFDITEDVSFFVRASKSISVLHLNLSGNAEYGIRGLGQIMSKQSQFHILFCPELHCVLNLKKGRRYIFIDICYPLDFIVQALMYYPVFEEFKERIQSLNFSLITHEEVFINARLADRIYHLIQSPFSPNVRGFHLDLFSQLLHEALKCASSLHLKAKKFFLPEIENIYTAKEYIDAHLFRHFTISEISRKAGINEQKLKKGFKEVFGKGLFAYLLSERLAIARTQLEQTNKPIKEIASDAGYKSASNFATAFKKMFGLSPLNFRNQCSADKYLKNAPA